MKFKRKAKYKQNNIKKQINQKLNENETNLTKGIYMIHSIGCLIPMSDGKYNRTTTTRIQE